MADLRVTIGSLLLKNPVICASGEHTLTDAGIRAGLAAGAAVVVAKSLNESEPARVQLAHTDYARVNQTWRIQPWHGPAARHDMVLCRSGLQPRAFDDWLAAVAQLDREAAQQNAYVAASIILAGLDAAVAMARAVEAAGVRLLEFNIGTPYGDEAKHGGVTTERSAERVREVVTAVCGAVQIPVWVKLTGQSENVASLAQAARAGGAAAVIMIGRSLGMLPDLATMKPTLGTNLGYGGGWALPITCYWLARSRQALGAAYPLIGTNGARSGDDVARMLLAGASAVEMASVVMTNGFGVLKEAVTALERYCDQHGRAVSDLIGVAADQVAPFESQPYRPRHWEKFVPSETLGR